MKKKNNIDILDLFQDLFEFIGNPVLVNLIKENKEDEDELNKKLRNYINGILEKSVEEGEEETPKDAGFSYIYLNGVIIDYHNIARIELDSNYNVRKNKQEYFIKIIKKYPSPLEEEYIIPFDSEEERDKGYDVLRRKLSLCKIYIC